MKASGGAVSAAPWAGEEGLEYAWISPVEGVRPEGWMDERVVDGTDRFAQYAIAGLAWVVPAA